MGLLAPVSYARFTDDEVFEHFATLAGEGRLSLRIYDNRGSTHVTFSAARVGGKVWYSAFAGPFPKVSTEMWSAIQKKDAPETRRRNARLQSLWEFFKRYSSRRVMHVAGVLAVSHAVPPRPLSPLPDTARE